MEEPEELWAEVVPVVDFWEDDLDQLGEALGIDARVRDAGCGSAVLLWQILGSGVCRPRALRSVFPLIPAKQTHAQGRGDTRVSMPLPPGAGTGCSPWVLPASPVPLCPGIPAPGLSEGHHRWPLTLLPGPGAPSSAAIPG